MDDGGAANNVARAIAVALDWSSPLEARKAAVSYLEYFKNGDIRTLTTTSFLLVKKECSSEIRLHGLKMLQHLVRFRWDELGFAERIVFAKASVNLIIEMVDPCEEWALKSQTAALIAEVIRREGTTLLLELLPSLISLSNNGSLEAELVAMVLRWLPEDITVHNEDLDGDRRRLLLRGLTDSLKDILPLLYTLLERHFGGALNEFGFKHFDVAKQHVAAVTAILNAINAYAEWVPVQELSTSGLIHGCGFLLSSVEFRLHACEFFKLLSQRKRPTDASASDFDSAISNIFQILMAASREFLNRGCSRNAGIDETEFEFVECLCENMVVLGSSHVHCIADDEKLIEQYLQQMLGYFQHFKFALHFQSLLFWLTTMRELVSKTKATAQIPANPGIGSGKPDIEKKVPSLSVDENIQDAILDVSFKRMLNKNTSPGNNMSIDDLELWSEDFDGKSDFSQYRSKLLELIRHVTFQRPVMAASKISHRIDFIIKSYFHMSISTQDVAPLESTQLGLETVVNAIFDGSAAFISCDSETKFQLHRILDGLLKQLFTLKWTEPSLAIILGRYLDSLGSYLKYFPDSVADVVNKLFEILTLIPLDKESSFNAVRVARLQVCQSLIRIARAAEDKLLPHMKSIADTMAFLEAKGHLYRSELNLLGEAVLIMASSAGIHQQQEALAWLLEPLSKQWIQSDWQNSYLSEPFGIVRLCADKQFMWSVFHTVTFFEKAIKRSGVRKGILGSQIGSSSDEFSVPTHPMSSHLPWMLPPILRLLRSLHSLWSQPLDRALTSEMKAAKCMGRAEQTTLLGESNFKQSRSLISSSEGSEDVISQEGESNEGVIRNWLKAIRDSGYNVVGLSATIGDTFFRCMDSSSLALSLLENIQSMEFRHIKQLIHLVIIPLVKLCPADLWEMWLGNLLHPLLLHCYQALSCSWTSLLLEGRAKVPDTFGNLHGMELKIEVMEEKLLRNLTREVCLLLATLASPCLNTGLPSLEQLGNTNRMESSLSDLDAFASTSIIGFLLKHKGPALPVLRLSIEAFTWTDGESISKLAHFLGSVILLAVASKDVELKEFVAKDLFYATIQGLTLESNAIISAELVGLCREIFICFSDCNPAPRQILLSLPNVTQADFVAFEDAFSKTTSPKEQKLLMKSLLLLGSGNNLKALAAQRNINVMTNVTARIRASSTRYHTPGGEEDDVIGLAAFKDEYIN